jgi:hypothetical protein
MFVIVAVFMAEPVSSAALAYVPDDEAGIRSFVEAALDILGIRAQSFSAGLAQLMSTSDVALLDDVPRIGVRQDSR